MALINCPGCNERISDVTRMCPHCGVRRAELDETQLLEMRRRQLRDRVYHLKMTMYGVMSFFLIAFGWYWWESDDFQNPPTAGPLALLVLGGLAYLVLRFLLFRAKKALRSLLGKA